MIDLKRNPKKGFAKATGKRVKKKSIYSPRQSSDFQMSRSKFSDFLTCLRCFYLDRVSGLETPKTPGWTLNSTVDNLLKKEFDESRKNKKPHRLFKENGLGHLVPFDHPEMDNWRDALHHGLRLRYKNTNIILSGGIDDIWQDTKTKKLIVVDYKSQAKNGLVTTKDYLDDAFHDGYKIQMDFYAYLLSGMGFDVDPTSYFLVCNAKTDENGFHATMHFDEYLIPYNWNKEWIEEKIDQMLVLINQHEIPKPHPSCRNCAYSDQYSKALNDLRANPAMV